jgi:capsular polysaccharide synthesis protein
MVQKLKVEVLTWIRKQYVLHRGVRFFYQYIVELKRLVMDCYLYWYVQRKIVPQMGEESYDLPVDKDQDVIWVCWFQGLENAPDVVRACYRALCKKVDHPVILITEQNFSQYVNFPIYLLDKYHRGVVSHTHFSDALRTAILYQHGGIWIDSTMLLTAAIPSYIWEAKRFVFSFRPEVLTYQIASNQFIRAHAGDVVLGRTLRGLYGMWRTRKSLKDYFIYHYIFAAAVRMSPETEAEFRCMPIRFSESNHIMQRFWLDAFDPDMWEWLKSRSFVHKLTYKITGPVEKYSYAWYIIHGEDGP